MDKKQVAKKVIEFTRGELGLEDKEARDGINYARYLVDRERIGTLFGEDIKTPISPVKEPQEEPSVEKEDSGEDKEEIPLDDVEEPTPEKEVGGVFGETPRGKPNGYKE